MIAFAWINFHSGFSGCRWTQKYIFRGGREVKVESYLNLGIAGAGAVIGGLFPLLIHNSIENLYRCFWFVFRRASTFNLCSRSAFV